MPSCRYGLTIMVNNIIKSQFKDVEEAQLATLATDSPLRELSNNVPLYDRTALLEKIKDLKSEDDEDLFFNFVTTDSRDDWYELLDLHDGVILSEAGLTVDLRLKHVFETALSSASHFYKSELCMTSRPKRWLACDVYVFNLEYWTEGVGRPNYADFYLKYCISSEGTVYLVCSCHFSKKR